MKVEVLWFHGKNIDGKFVIDESHSKIMNVDGDIDAYHVESELWKHIDKGWYVQFTEID